MRRFPILPTLVVTLAVAAMIALGLWQLLDRLPKKEAFLAQLATNPTKSVIAFPRHADEALLFRRASAVCPAPTSIRLAGAGAAGYRAIAECPPVGDQPALPVQLGTTRDPNARPRWAGGRVEGHLAHAPTGQSLIGTALDPASQRLMLVASRPLAGLKPNPAPDIDAVPNNHLAYAGQWFFFAAVAAIIYVLAVARRRR